MSDEFVQYAQLVENARRHGLRTLDEPGLRNALTQEQEAAVITAVMKTLARQRNELAAEINIHRAHSLDDLGTAADELGKLVHYLHTSATAITSGADEPLPPDPPRGLEDQIPRRTVDKPLVDALCRETVERHRAYEALLGDPDAHTVRLTYTGEIIGLRMALCYIHGWDPEEESDKEGKADELVTDWWQRNHPENWKY